MNTPAQRAVLVAAAVATVLVVAAVGDFAPRTDEAGQPPAESPDSPPAGAAGDSDQQPAGAINAPADTASIEWHRAANAGALMTAVMTRNIDAVRDLLEQGTSPDAVDPEGITALARAIELQEAEIIDLLLDAGTNLDTVPGSQPVIMTALMAGDEALAIDLLQRGAPASTLGTDSPLVEAISNGANDDLFAALLTAGADVNAPDGNGQTPLVAAIADGNPARAAELLRLGANPNAPGPDGLTPLQLATNPGDQQIIELLERSGASPL